MLHWMPYTHCHLSFWRNGREPKLSPLEKYDTLLREMGGREAFAAAYEATDARPWISYKYGLKPGHNCGPAVAQNGGNTSGVPWWNWTGREWSRADQNVSWWGHCNGWSAASVSFKESKFQTREINVSARSLLNRQYFGAAQNANLAGLGDASGGKLTYDKFYQQSQGGPLTFYDSDQKAILVEYGMQLKPNPTFTAGSRFNAPVMDIEEKFFERGNDGKVKVPTDAQYVWLYVTTTRGTFAMYVQQGYPNDMLLDWKERVIKYYQGYYGASVSAQFVARYANLPADPGVVELSRLPVPVRKSYLDMNPQDFKTKLVEAVGEGRHGLIVEVIAGSQVWNYPVLDFDDIGGNVGETNSRANNDVVQMFNLSQQDPSVLIWNGSTATIRYRPGQLTVHYQRPSPYTDQSTNQQTTVLTHVYTYYDFLDAQNRVVSSTWYGESVKDHPDFCWYPDLNSATAADGNNPSVNPYVKAQYVNQMIPNLGAR